MVAYGILAAMAKRGRPPKYSLKRVDIIVQAIRAGASREAAAGLAGIGHATLYRWLAEGRSNPDGPFGKFAKAVEEADAAFEVEALKAIREAAAGGTTISRTTKPDGTVIEKFSRPDWTAAAWLLERKWPSRYGARGRVEIELQRQALEFAQELGVSPGALLEEAVNLVVSDAKEVASEYDDGPAR